MHKGSSVRKYVSEQNLRTRSSKEKETLLPPTQNKSLPESSYASDERYARAKFVFRVPMGLGIVLCHGHVKDNTTPCEAIFFLPGFPQ